MFIQSINNMFKSEKREAHEACVLDYHLSICARSPQPFARDGFCFLTLSSVAVLSFKYLELIAFHLLICYFFF